MVPGRKRDHARQDAGPVKPADRSACRYIALLRGVNLGGHNKIPMAELRLLATEMGWGCVQTYGQSGNMVFSSASTQAALEAQLEQAITQHFELRISVIVRNATEWSRYLQVNPFPQAAMKEPHLVALALSKSGPPPDAAAALQKSATNGERIMQVRDAVFIHFPCGFGKSRIPALLDRVTGAPVTARNWRTVLKLNELGGH